MLDITRLAIHHVRARPLLLHGGLFALALAFVSSGVGADDDLLAACIRYCTANGN
jgi:hypothetical protein